MNIDHVRPLALVWLGRAQTAFGRAVGSARLRQRGVGLQLEGQTRRCLADANRLFKLVQRR